MLLKVLFDHCPHITQHCSATVYTYATGTIFEDNLSTLHFLHLSNTCQMFDKGKF
jgi:hypothetical protein